jgi:hypothetical protein
MSGSSIPRSGERLRGGATSQDVRDGADEPAEASLAVRLPELLLAAAWRHRWRLAPVYLAGTAAVGAATAPVWTIGGLSVTAAAVEAAACTGVTAPGGRMLMSRRERRIAATGLAGAAAWTGTTTVPGLPMWLDAALLAAATGWQSTQWWTSRRRRDPEPEPASRLSPLAAALLDGWANEIQIGSGPRTLRGSWPVEDSVTEPAEGAVVMRVQLAHGVHAKQAISAATRDAVEALYGLPEDTVRLETVRDDSTQLQVTFTPSRHLEREGGLDWVGPVLNADGSVPLAERLDGGEVAIPLYSETRVRHGFISGTTGAGKSVSSVSVMLPGIAAGIEVCLLIDGKRGTSTPYLRPVVARYARLEHRWPLLIEMAYRIMKERELRRGAAGLHEWNTPQESDPIITLIMDDVTAINRVIKGKHVEMVCEMLEHGQAVGVRVIQITQSPSFEDIIGGVKARNLMTSGGFAICHRAGGSGASRLTLDSTRVDVDLRGLPNGQAAITVEGQLVGYPAQVRNATKARVLEVLPTIQPRELDGADLRAAGAEWFADHWATCWETPSGAPVAPRGVPAPRQEDAPQSEAHDLALHATLRTLHAGGPMTRQTLEAALALPLELVERALADLARAELVVHGDGRYVLAPSIRPGSEGDALLRRLAAAGYGVPAHLGTTTADEAGDEDLPGSRRWVLDQLLADGEGLTLGQLQDVAQTQHADGVTGAPSRRTISNALADLLARGAVSKNGAVWTPAEVTAGNVDERGE